mmetsp:Transcript_90113/g.165370  ORF Transcript_90113/g.165370 Transcript_90113/m.165370 type:complete len:202 (-) Transcript_90113:1925-2530(-)
MASLTHPSIRSTFAFATFACIELPRNSALRMTFTFTLAAHLGFQVGQEVCQLRSFWCVRGIYLLADASGCYVCLMSTLDISQPFLGKTNVDQNAHAMLGLQSPNALKDVMAVFVGLQSALHVVLALLRSGDAVHQHMSCGAVHLAGILKDHLCIFESLESTVNIAYFPLQGTIAVQDHRTFRGLQLTNVLQDCVSCLISIK